MAQSRVRKGKEKKTNIWLRILPIVLVLVVVIAGYFIIRKSKAASYVSEPYTVNYLQGYNGATKTKITKSDGTGSIDVWALGKDAYVKTIYNGSIINPIDSRYNTNGYTVNVCSNSQRPDNSIGQAELKVDSGIYTNKAVLNIGVSKIYCSNEIKSYLHGYGSSAIVPVLSITNKSNYILYVTDMSFAWWYSLSQLPGL